MKFLINDQFCEESGVEPDLTLLRYLRENKALPGTKEGCASGDCGACTVLVGELNTADTDDTAAAPSIRYHSINACITPLYSLEGKQVVTVEYLAGKPSMHPAQQAMVEHHGSQCGYCTPGFVMSLAGLYEQAKQTKQAPTRHQVCEAISGNLCRCTGYRPIVDAGLAMDLEADSRLNTDAPATTEKLKTLQIEASASTKESALVAPNYYKPLTEAALQSCLAELDSPRIIAGGTDLMLEVTQQYRDIEQLVDVSEVSTLKNIESLNGQLTIGASVSYSQLEAFFKTREPQLHALFERIASQQIRNRGTIGGNIANASPIGDLPPVLLALDAVFTLKNAAGSVRLVPANEFYQAYKKTVLAPGEYIASIEINEHVLHYFARYLKVSKRIEDDISSVLLACRVETEGDTITAMRIAYGGMAAVPIRVDAAEQALAGKAINDEAALDEAISAIRSNLTPMSDVRASAKYRLDIACNLLRKAWMELNGEPLPLLTNSHSFADFYDASVSRPGSPLSPPLSSPPPSLTTSSQPPSEAV